MEASEKQGLLKLALGGGLALLGTMMGDPTGISATVAKNLAEGIGGDFISAFTDESVGRLAEPAQRSLGSRVPDAYGFRSCTAGKPGDRVSTVGHHLYRCPQRLVDLAYSHLEPVARGATHVR